MNGEHKALLIGLSSRILVVVVFIISSFLFTTSSEQVATQFSNPLPLVNLFYRYDSGFYITIARTGYPIGYPAHDWAFFPLYPIVTKALSHAFIPLSTTNSMQLTGLLQSKTALGLTEKMEITNALELSGFLVSNIAFFVSVYFFYKLTHKIISKRIALISTAFFSFWAGSVFYSAIYSEALFMALLLGTFYYLEEDKLTIAVLLGFLASFTRSNGFLIFVPFLFYALQLRTNKSKTIKLVASSALVASPFLFFQLFGYIFAGNVFPITQVARDSNWGANALLPLQLLTISNFGARIFSFYFLGILLMFIPIGYFIIRIRPKSIKSSLIQDSKQLKYWAFYASMLFVLIDQALIYSVIRYAVSMLPIYWVSAIIYTKNRSIGIGLFVLMTGMLIIGSILLEAGGPFPFY